MADRVSFNIEFHRFIDSEGQLDSPLPSHSGDPETLRALYRNMVLTRKYDERAIALQRTGQLGTYASVLGQEAIGAGIGLAMASDDVFVPSYREPGAQLLRGARLRDFLLYWGGDERGMDFPGARQDFPLCVPIASQTCHAVGAAFALKQRGTAAVVCALGDGATSKGDFYESLNLAGVWKLPVVFVINNNQWAISVPRSSQSGAETLAQKAIAAGMPGLQIDGNDVVSVHHFTSEALARARRGEGPTLIEALTYRLSDHTTADDATRYRSQEELQQHWADDPIERLKTYLENHSYLSNREDAQLREQCIQEVEQEVAAYLAMPPQAATAMFDYLYQELPRELMSQRNSVIEEE